MSLGKAPRLYHQFSPKRITPGAHALNPAASTPDTQFVRLSGKKRPITRLVIVVTVFACLLVMGFAAWFIAASRQA